VKESPGSAPAVAQRPAATQQVTSLRSQKPAWHRAAKPGATNEVRQRVIVYVAGGMTYSEIREAYKLSAAHGKDIFIGKV
jgi:syntaxin-binding protein 1